MENLSLLPPGAVDATGCLSVERIESCSPLSQSLQSGHRLDRWLLVIRNGGAESRTPLGGICYPAGGRGISVAKCGSAAGLSTHGFSSLDCSSPRCPDYHHLIPLSLSRIRDPWALDGGRAFLISRPFGSPGCCPPCLSRQAEDTDSTDQNIVGMGAWWGAVGCILSAGSWPRLFSGWSD